MKPGPGMVCRRSYLFVGEDETVTRRQFLVEIVEVLDWGELIVRALYGKRKGKLLRFWAEDLIALSPLEQLAEAAG